MKIILKLILILLTTFISSNALATDDTTLRKLSYTPASSLDIKMIELNDYYELEKFPYLKIALAPSLFRSEGGLIAIERVPQWTVENDKEHLYLKLSASLVNHHEGYTSYQYCQKVANTIRSYLMAINYNISLEENYNDLHPDKLFIFWHIFGFDKAVEIAEGVKISISLSQHDCRKISNSLEGNACETEDVRRVVTRSKCEASLTEYEVTNYTKRTIER